MFDLNWSIFEELIIISSIILLISSLKSLTPDYCTSSLLFSPYMSLSASTIAISNAY